LLQAAGQAGGNPRVELIQLDSEGARYRISVTSAAPGRPIAAPRARERDPAQNQGRARTTTSAGAPASAAQCHAVACGQYKYEHEHDQKTWNRVTLAPLGAARVSRAVRGPCSFGLLRIRYAPEARPSAPTTKPAVRHDPERAPRLGGIEALRVAAFGRIAVGVDGALSFEHHHSGDRADRQSDQTDAAEHVTHGFLVRARRLVRSLPR
jgi:hypothetical protein